METHVKEQVAPRKIIEQSATPLVISELCKNNQSTLFIVPHPNDLILSCSGLIAHLIQNKSNVYVTFLTSGFDIRSDSTTDFVKNRKQRERETLRACLKLGIRRNKIFFMHLGQRRSWFSKIKTEIDVKKHLQKIITKKAVGTVFLPWRRDPHFEHVQTFLIGQKAIKDHKITMFEFPILLWETDHQEYWPIDNEVDIKAIPLGDYYDTKLKAIGAFESKTKILDNNTDAFILKKHDISYYLKTHEYFFKTKNQDRVT